jgi:hypothetical protein
VTDWLRYARSLDRAARRRLLTALFDLADEVIRLEDGRITS